MRPIRRSVGVAVHRHRHAYRDRAGRGNADRHDQRQRRHRQLRRSRCRRRRATSRRPRGARRRSPRSTRATPTSRRAAPRPPHTVNVVTTFTGSTVAPGVTGTVTLTGGGANCSLVNPQFIAVAPLTPPPRRVVPVRALRLQRRGLHDRRHDHDPDRVQPGAAGRDAVLEIRAGAGQPRAALVPACRARTSRATR